MTGTIENRSKFLETLFEKRGGVELPFEPYVPISDLPETHLAHLTTEELLDIAKEQASRVSANLIETSSFEMNEVIRQLIEKSGGGQVMIPSTDEFEKLGVKYIEKDGIFYPLITLDGEEKNADVGKYGHMWIDYIRTVYSQRYKSLVRFGELHDKAAEVNEVAYELLEDIEKEWLGEHKPKQANSFVEMYRLRTQARIIAEEVVLHDVVNCFH